MNKWQEHEHHWFVDALLAGLSYERFFSLMTDECRRQQQQQQQIQEEQDDIGASGGYGGGGMRHK